MNSEYRCLRCKFYWHSYRVLFDNDGKMVLKTGDCPGPTDCPKCKSTYVHWVSVKEDLKALGSEACPHWDDHPPVDLNPGSVVEYPEPEVEEREGS